MSINIIIIHKALSNLNQACLFNQFSFLLIKILIINNIFIIINIKRVAVINKKKKKCYEKPTEEM